MSILRSFSVFLLVIMTSYTTVGHSQTLLIVGDSLSASYNIPLESGWVELLKGKLDDEGFDTTVVNASIAGETTRNALKRLPDLLKRHQPDVVVIELGGNDGLRGFDLKSIRNNLASMIEQSQAVEAEVVLTGIFIPPNYGPAYTQIFSQAYQQLAKEYSTILVPFILDGVGDNPELMQADGVHPTAGAQPKVLSNMWPYIEKALQQDLAASSTSTE